MTQKLIDFLEYLVNNRLPSKKEKALFFIFATVFAYGVYTMAFASQTTLKFLGAHNIDKIPHILAGVIISGTYEWASRHRSFRGLALMFIFIAIGWEIFEISFVPNVKYFYQISPDLWRLDTIGDIVADFLGTYSYWVFVMKRTK